MTALRFCMVTTFYPPHSFGGDGVYVEQLSRALARRGHHVEVIHCVDAYNVMRGDVGQIANRTSPAPGPEEHDPASRVIVHSLRSRLGPLSPLLTQQLGAPVLEAARIREIFARGFDVIHYHNVSLVGGPDVLTYGRGVKLYTMHEYWLVCPTHLLYKMGREVCETPSCVACTLRHGRPPQLWRYTGKLRAALSHVDALIAMSPSCAERHRTLSPYAPVVELPAFVDASPVREGTIRPPAQGPYFLFVGRLEAIKGLQSVLPLFGEGGRAAAPSEARLLVAGSGSYEHELRRMATGSPRVEFLGKMDRERLSALYRGARALVVPSLTLEIAPLVILEAFQHGTPVLARAQGGMRDYVDASGGGATYRDDAELVAGMQAAMTPEWRDERGERGRRAYEAHWTEEAHLSRYLALVEEIRTRGPRGGIA